MLLQNRIFKNQFTVQRKLSAGSFGIVYLGLDQNTKQEVAIKVEREENEDVRSLDREVQIFKHLGSMDGIPKLIWSGEEFGYNIIVMQLLGNDLAYHFKQLKRFTLKTALLIAIQLIDVLEKLHFQGVIHRDLKPENILLGSGKENGKIYLLDFGISKIYRDCNNKHIPFREHRSFLGTTRYASIAAHLGHELSRKDDLESMMYIILYFIRGQLPWQNMLNVTDDERTKKVGEMKLLLQQEIFRDQPKEFQKIFDYIRKLQFQSEPNYKMITFELKKAAESLKLNLDGFYDWTEIRSSTHYDSLVPHNSTEMKKSIEKQLSGILNQQNSNQLLAPPPQFSSRNNLNGREENKKPTLASFQENIQIIMLTLKQIQQVINLMNIQEINVYAKNIVNSISNTKIFVYYPNMINDFKELYVILILFLFNNIQFMQLLTLNSNNLIEEFQTEKKYQEDTKQLLQLKVQDFHKKMQKDRNEKLFKKKRQMAVNPPILQDDQIYPYQLDENDFEDEEIYHMNKFEEIQKELEAFYQYKI
ncbi:unnamed protein product [Paramecium primaurelia]|uniref:Casein kinase I n=1 Tax=Paramecium primaurelia TaxID=5886 RepID=A0A8S1P187_PARPR|nr:unnamed protein product [Paramecium primaurelia]